MDMEGGDAGAGPSNRESMPDDGRFHCPFPDCTRSFAELWRLKVHYRAPPDVRGSGKERGHGTELGICPKCWTTLKPGKHHVGCSWGKTTQRKRLRQSSSSQLIPGVGPGGDGSSQQQFAGGLAPQYSPQPQPQMQQAQPWMQQPWPQQQPQQQHAQPQMLVPKVEASPSGGLTPPLGYPPAGNFPMAPFEPFTAPMGVAPQQFMPMYQQQPVEPQQSAFGGMAAFPSTAPPPQPQQPMPQLQHRTSLPHQPSAPPPEEPTAGFLGSVFDDDGEFTYVPNIPSPPHLPRDFPAGTSQAGAHAPQSYEAPPGPPPPGGPGTGLLFNFGQFSQRMPSQGSMAVAQYKGGTMPRTMVDLPGTEMPADANVLAHDDGDIMHLLFGLPDELPTMSTIHVHKWISRSEHDGHAADDEPPARHYHHGSFGDLEHLLKEEEGPALGTAAPPAAAAPQGHHGADGGGAAKLPNGQNGRMAAPYASAAGTLGGDGMKQAGQKEEDKAGHDDVGLLDNRDSLLHGRPSHLTNLVDDFLLDGMPRGTSDVCVDELQLLTSAE